MSSFAKEADMLDVHNPYDGSRTRQVPIGTAEGVERALSRARALFDDRSGWLPAYRRVEMLE